MNKNPYDYLNLKEVYIDAPIKEVYSFKVTDSRVETVIIYSAVHPSGLWIYGYLVCWANGRCSSMDPSVENGSFRSQNDAILYAIGFMKLYLEYFTAETQAALIAAESRFSQATLF